MFNVSPQLRDTLSREFLKRLLTPRTQRTERGEIWD
jgi:hypothetical protein